MEDVVQALELASPLQGEHVEGLLHHAQPTTVPTWIAADRAERSVADVEAAVAEHDLVADVHEGGRERPGLAVRRAEEVVGQALGGLGPHPGQAGEGLDEAGDRFDQGRGHESVGGRARGPES